MTVLTTFHRHIAKTALRIPKLMGASALIVFASQPSFAAFKVIESQPATTNTSASAPAQANSANGGFLPAPVFNDPNAHVMQGNVNQQMAEEVMQLRGLVEQLSYEIEVLKSQSKERYIDLDARILDLYRQQQDLSTNTAAAPVAPANQAPAISNDEQALYDKARNLMKARDYDAAISEFQRVTTQYPQSNLAANAWYWLGEIWLVKNKISDAEKAFATVLSQFPQSNKRPDATYKLADVYEKTDRKSAAKQLYQKIMELFPTSNAARLAQRKLESL